MSLVRLVALATLAACASKTEDSVPTSGTDTSDTSDTSGPVDTGDTAGSGDTADSGDSADTVDTGDTGDTGTADACAEPADTASTRADTPVTFVDGDDTCDRAWSEADLAGWPYGGGCGWGYVWLRDDTRALALHLDLPADDELADHDWAYTFVPGHGADLQLLDASVGHEDLSYWSCSDFSETLRGTVWTAVAGQVSVQTRWVCDTTDPYCGFAETELHAQITLTGVGMENSAGECQEFPDTVLDVTLGISECGG